MESKFNNTLIDDDKLYGSNRQVDYYRDPIHNYLAYTVSENDNEITEKNTNKLPMDSKAEAHISTSVRLVGVPWS